MAQLPITSFLTFNGAPYIGEKDADNTNVVPSLMYVKNGAGKFVPQSATDPAPVTVTGRTPTTVTLQNAAIAVGVGTPFTVNGNATLTVEVAFAGTATGTVVLQGAETSGTFYNLGAVINLTTGTIVAQITASGLYQVDITGLDKVQANITSVTPGTGNITVSGKAVA